MARSATETIDPGEALVTEGSIGADLYFVRRGTFVVTVRDGNADAEVGRLGPGDVVGETQLIAGGRRTATVRALEPCTVPALPHAEFAALLAASEPLRESVAQVIRHRLREAALRVALPHAVGSDAELLDLLSELRIARGTIVFFSSDNGPHRDRTRTRYRSRSIGRSTGSSPRGRVCSRTTSS